MGLHYKGFTADIGYRFVLLLESRSSAPVLQGTYNGNAHVLGITVGYDWLFEKTAPAAAPAS